MRIILVFSLSISFYLCRVMDQYRSSFKQVNYITDTVGHSGGNFGYEDFNRKFREWEIRRGFRDENTPTVLRGMSLRSSRTSTGKSKKRPL
jgi:hypothetical protein